MRARDEILRRIDELVLGGQRTPDRPLGEPSWVREKMIRELRWALGLCRCGHPHRGTKCSDPSCGCTFGDGMPATSNAVEHVPEAVAEIGSAATEPVPEHIDDKDEAVTRFSLLEID